MSFIVELSNHPQRARFVIKLKGFTERFYAENSAEVALAIDHHFRGENCDPRHWGTGAPKCPLCKRNPE